MSKPDAHAIDSYLTYLRDVRRMSPNTIENYARDLASLATFAEQRTLPVEQLQRRDLEAFVRSLMSSGLSPRSVARTVGARRANLNPVIAGGNASEGRHDE